MERVGFEQHTCMLVRADGMYHYEHKLRLKVDIFEGNIGPDEIATVTRILSDDRLRLLAQKEIKAPLIVHTWDVFALNLKRRDGWQNLQFPSPESRKPFRESLDAPMNLLESIQKNPHIVLSKDTGQTNCLPPEEPALKIRPEEKPPENGTEGPSPHSSGNGYVFRMLVDRFGGLGAESDCLAVFDNGQYRFEKRTQQFREQTATPRVFEGFLPSEKLTELRQILDDQALRKKKFEQAPYGFPIHQAKTTRLTIQRGDETQQIEFWEFTAGGGFTTATYEDNGVELLKPLQQWMKRNISDHRDAERRDLQPSNCIRTP